MFVMPPLPSIPIVRAGLIARRLKLAGLAASTLRIVATGRTGSGKTTIANRLLGLDYFLSTGRQDCTRDVNLIRFPGGLSYADLPGVCSDDKLENFNRAALGIDQIADFPLVEALSFAEFDADAPPRMTTVAVADAPEICNAPDLILYVLAADKQFLSSDRLYLRDLLTRHRRLIYVLNVFATSPPTEGNVRDLVSRVAEVHRDAVGRNEVVPIVAVDCRTGDGLAELLVAARNIVGQPSGQLLSDVVVDQQRETPRIYAATLRRYLGGLAAEVAAWRAGPADAEHDLHRWTAALEERVAELRRDGALASCASRYRAVIVDALGRSDRAPPTNASDVARFVRELVAVQTRIESDALRRASRVRDAIQSACQRLTQADRVQATEQSEAFDAELNAFQREQAALIERMETFAAAAKVHSEAQDEYKVAERDLQFRSAQLDVDKSNHEDRIERLSDRIESLDDALSQLQAGGASIGETLVRQLDREQDRIERDRDRLNRQGDRLNDDIEEFNQDIARHRARADALNRQVSQLTARRDAIAADRADLTRRSAAIERKRHGQGVRERAMSWADRRFAGPINAAFRGLDQARGQLEQELRETVGRARQLEELATMPSFNHEAAAAELDDRRLRLAASEQRLVEAIVVVRRIWTRFVLDRAIAGVLLEFATDHFSEGGTPEYRGTTYERLGLAGAAYALTASHVLISPVDAVVDFPGRQDQIRSLLRPSGPNSSSPVSLAEPEVLGELFPSDFDRAVEGLTVLSHDCGRLP